MDTKKEKMRGKEVRKGSSNKDRRDRKESRSGAME